MHPGVDLQHGEAGRLRFANSRNKAQLVATLLTRFGCEAEVRAILAAERTFEAALEARPPYRPRREEIEEELRNLDE